MKVEILRQLSVAIENQPGRLGQIGRLLADREIQIEAFSMIDNVEQGMVRLITSDPVAARAALSAGGLPVVEVEVLVVEINDHVGALALIGDALSAADINIEYAYASSVGIGQPGRIVFRTAGPQQARDLLLAIPVRR